MVALVGLRYHGSEYAWMDLDLDWPDGHGVGTSESHGHSLDGATNPREPGKGLSSLSTKDERILPMVSSGLAVNECRIKCATETFLYQLAGQLSSHLI